MKSQTICWWVNVSNKCFLKHELKQLFRSYGVSILINLLMLCIFGMLVAMENVFFVDVFI